MVHPVGLSMIVRNEQANIKPCLQTVVDLVAAIVIADTGSTDHTREYPAEFGTWVINFPWCDDLAAAQNASLDHISTPWVFWMDADDNLTDDQSGNWVAPDCHIANGALKSSNVAVHEFWKRQEHIRVQTSTDET